LQASEISEQEKKNVQKAEEKWDMAERRKEWFMGAESEEMEQKAIKK
jgi:hypothetical protein